MNIKFLFRWAKENGIELPKNRDGNINIPASFDLYDEWKKKKGTAENSNSGQTDQKKVISNELTPFSEHEKQNWLGSPKIVVAESKEQCKDFIEKTAANDESVRGKTLFLGKLGDRVSKRIRDETGISLNGYNLKIPYSELRHAIEGHGSDKEELKGQKPITTDDILNFVEVVTEFDKVKPGDTEKDLVFIKRIGQRHYAVTNYADGSHSLNFKTFYINKK